MAASVVSSNSAGRSERWVPTTVEEGFPHAINERGQMVGEGSDSEYDPAMTEAFVWQISAPMQTGRSLREGPALSGPFVLPLPRDWVWASAINDGGSIAGGTDGKRCALLWPRGRTLRVPFSFREGESAEASDINNRGQIVGWSGVRPVIWEKVQLRALPGGQGKAYAINDRGVIAGTVGRHAVMAARKAPRARHAQRKAKQGCRHQRSRSDHRPCTAEKRCMVCDAGRRARCASSARASFRRRSTTAVRSSAHAASMRVYGRAAGSHCSTKANTRRARWTNERQQIVGWKMVVLSGLNPWWNVVLWTYKR